MKYLAGISFSEAESWLIDASFFEADGTTPLDLTGAEVEWGLAPALDEAAVLTADSGSGGGIEILGDPAEGKVRIRLDPGAHSGVLPGAYVHQARVILSDGFVSLQFQGPFEVRESLFVPPAP